MKKFKPFVEETVTLVADRANIWLKDMDNLIEVISWEMNITSSPYRVTIIIFYEELDIHANAGIGFVFHRADKTIQL